MQKVFDISWNGITRFKKPGVLSCFRSLKQELDIDIIWNAGQMCHFDSESEAEDILDGVKAYLLVWDDHALVEEESEIPVRDDILEVAIVGTMTDILKARLKARGIKVILDAESEPAHMAFVVTSAIERYSEAWQLKHKLEYQGHLAQYKNMFFSSVCHELKNPLNGITVAAGMLSNDLELHRRMEYLEVIRTGIDMLHPIIGDMVDMTKIESGRIALKERSIHVARLLREIMVTNSILAEQKGVVLRSYLDEEVSNVLVGDGDRLKQILFNLVSNGIKYTDEGYVHIHCELIESTRDKEHLRFKVTDSGYGIPQEYHEAIFEPFERAGARPSCRSFGLGLTVAKHLVELMGGRLKVESKIGCGSRFEFDVRLGKMDFQG